MVVESETFRHLQMYKHNMSQSYIYSSINPLKDKKYMFSSNHMNFHEGAHVRSLTKGLREKV